MRTNAWTGRHEDDLRAFFSRPPRDVSDADVLRWRAACAALRGMDGDSTG